MKNELVIDKNINPSFSEKKPLFFILCGYAVN